MKTKRKLRNYFIDKEIQLRLVIVHVVFVLLSFAIVGGIVYLSVWPVISEYVPYALVCQLHYRILGRIAGLGIPLVLVIMGASFVISHKIAGPLYRMDQALSRLIHGEAGEPIQLRKTDLLKGMANKINILVFRFAGAEDGRGRDSADK